MFFIKTNVEKKRTHYHLEQMDGVPKPRRDHPRLNHTWASMEYPHQDRCCATPKYTQTSRYLNAAQQRWQSHTADVRNKLGISREYNPWTVRPRSLTGVPTDARTCDLLNVAWAARLNNSMSEAEAKEHFFVDISQGVQRRRWGSLSTVLQGILV